MLVTRAVSTYRNRTPVFDAGLCRVHVVSMSACACRTSQHPRAVNILYGCPLRAATSVPFNAQDYTMGWVETAVFAHLVHYLRWCGNEPALGQHVRLSRFCCVVPS
jgi:hypothetical protein